MNKAIIAILLSLTLTSPSFSSALYGNCKLTEDSNIKNRPKGDDWNLVKKDTSVELYSSYKNYGYIKLTDGWMGWIELKSLVCDDTVWKRIAIDKK